MRRLPSHYRFLLLLTLVIIAGIYIPAQAAEEDNEAVVQDDLLQGESNQENANGDPDTPKTPSQGNTETRELSGFSVFGNRELPKSLYIVPWKNSTVEVETEISGDALTPDLAPIDRPEFLRQLNYYDFSQQQRR